MVADPPTTFLTVIEIFGGNVPPRRNEPTQTLQGREGTRSNRAKQVSASRSDQTRLFNEIARLMGHNGNQAPRRELLLKAGKRFVFFSLATPWLTPGTSTLYDSCGYVGTTTTTNDDRNVTSCPPGGRRTGWTPLDGFTTLQDASSSVESPSSN